MNNKAAYSLGETKLPPYILPEIRESSTRKLAHGQIPIGVNSLRLGWLFGFKARMMDRYD